jgi:hypothetical protein
MADGSSTPAAAAAAPQQLTKETVLSWAPRIPWESYTGCEALHARGSAASSSVGCLCHELTASTDARWSKLTVYSFTRATVP